MRPAIRVAVAALLLSGCASLGGGAADQTAGEGRVARFSLSGRLSIRQQDALGRERNDVLACEWRHDPPQDQLILRSPLGLQVMQLDETPGRVQLTLPDRAPLEAADEDALMQQALGYSLPVRGLAQWMRLEAFELPASTPGETVQRFDQDGWDGNLTRWRMLGSKAVPGLIVLEREGLRLRLVVDHWSLQRAQP